MYNSQHFATLPPLSSQDSFYGFPDHPDNTSRSVNVGWHQEEERIHSPVYPSGQGPISYGDPSYFDDVLSRYNRQFPGRNSHAIRNILQPALPPVLDTVQDHHIQEAQPRAMARPVYPPMETTPSSSFAYTSNYPPVDFQFASTTTTSSGRLYHDPLRPIGNPSLSGGPSFPISTLRSSFPNMGDYHAGQPPLTNPDLPSNSFLSPSPYFPPPLLDRCLNPGLVPSGSTYPSSSNFVPETAYDASEQFYSSMPSYGAHNNINFDPSFQRSLQHPPSLYPLPFRSEQQSAPERLNENPSSVHRPLIDLHTSLGEDHKPHDQQSNSIRDPAKIRKAHRDRRPNSPRIYEGSHVENPHTRDTAEFLAPVLQQKVRPSPADRCVCLFHAHPRKFPSFARHIRGHVMYAARSWLAGSSPYSDVLWLHATAIILKRDWVAIDEQTQNEIDQFLAAYREYSVSTTVQRGDFPMFSMKADEEASKWVVQWQCRICEVDLGRPDSLTRHMKHVHRIGQGSSEDT